ncbi:MAG: glycerophosphodiester phosphodiesterase [Acidobacteria bacterium]|nr:glycerophosphodiester phosphodiesterase [Acidobacteriota bacterium]
MKKSFLVLSLILLTVSSFAQTPRPFSIEGHRGARGYVPENTIPSFKKALEQGADTLELDVVITKDGKVVVSHEAWFSSLISLDKDSNRIPADKQRENNIYKMTYDEVKLFDVGSIGHKDFPQQEKMKVAKPLLKDVFTEIAKFVKANKLAAPRYNVEIKTEGVAGDDVFHPKMEPFTRMVYDVIKDGKMLKHVIVQSFDVRVLQELRKIDSKLPLALLVGNKDGIEKNLERLGFVPDTYSPNYMLVNAALVAACREKGLKIIPWTVNGVADLERMKTFDLDGIITDYPDRAVKVFKR